MLAAFFDQFNVVRLITIQAFPGDWLVTFTNSSMMMGLVIFIIWLLLRGERLVPNRWQSIMELIHSVMRSVVQENLGSSGQKYFPFVLCLFLFIVMLNVLGLFPYVFTPTAHIVITFGLSLSIIIAVILLGFVKFKLNFLSMLMPGGVPLGLAPFLVVIETLSFLVRAISLGVRLAANISAGHLLFGIISGFAFTMLSSGLMVLSIFPIMILGFITLLEIMVAVIQAYVFCLLTTIYLGDTVALH
uniref:ATP synthase subunit a n=1 Tax=Cliona patera TaxID=2910015 RepID=A0A9E8YZS4_9METZ|nr:ATP synthase F0 subunit 6 [Cliona patera]WAK85274.1 ATP synthase F0 subunit 6 [Cliona patera]WAK85288.1 ATP synthase F0 subunit 6 [Cliona patera]WAK85302.1 ATP synthase F0 subunit 6 [Cliona patera]WAK85316.1 ATP synthase F0 subunit 6 [Cliona patera]WAK85330.1 ATP synthase F0 subunit 6 [Cliona patera]